MFELVYKVHALPPLSKLEGASQLVVYVAWDVVRIIVSAALLTVPSSTISWMVYEPGRSSVMVGFTIVVLDSVAELPVGLEVTDHEYVKVSPSRSELPLPLICTVRLAYLTAVWSAPAFAVGARFGTLKVMVSVPLAVPSLTFNCRTYVPLLVGVKVGPGILGLENWALLRFGPEETDHE